MEMTRACWNIPDSFSTSSLLLWITRVSIYQNVLLWGQLPSTFITISMILCVPVSGECRCFGTHYLNAQRCNNLTAPLFKDVIECVFPVKWDYFTQVCFTCEANGGAAYAMCWPAGGEVFMSCSTLQPPPLSLLCLWLLLPLMSGVPAQTSFHSTEGEHMLET